MRGDYYVVPPNRRVYRPVPAHPKERRACAALITVLGANSICYRGLCPLAPNFILLN